MLKFHLLLDIFKITFQMGQRAERKNVPEMVIYYTIYVVGKL